MAKVGSSIDYYEKYCSKCKHVELGETDSPCKECIAKFFDDWRNPNRRLMGFKKVLMRMEDKDEQQTES